MRKALLTLVIVISAIVTSQAQVWLGGSISGHFNKEAKIFAIAPDVGYAIPNTPFSVACALEYEGSFLAGEGYSHALTVSPYVRYDICDIEERFYLFVDLVADIDAFKFNFFDIGLSPGVSFNISEHWSAEFSYGFVGYQRELGENKAIEHSFVLDFKAAAAEFGVYYNF